MKKFWENMLLHKSMFYVSMNYNQKNTVTERVSLRRVLQRSFQRLRESKLR